MKHEINSMYLLEVRIPLCLLVFGRIKNIGRGSLIPANMVSENMASNWNFVMHGSSIVDEVGVIVVGVSTTMSPAKDCMSDIKSTCLAFFNEQIKDYVPTTIRLRRKKAHILQNRTADLRHSHLFPSGVR